MGDATGKAMFTHVALYQAAVIAADILGENPARARYDAVPGSHSPTPKSVPSA